MTTTATHTATINGRAYLPAILVDSTTFTGRSEGMPYTYRVRSGRRVLVPATQLDLMGRICRPTMHGGGIHVTDAWDPEQDGFASTAIVTD